MGKVIRFTLGDKAATAALGVNITDADIAAKLEAGAQGLLLKGVTNVGGACVDKSGNIYVSDYAKHVILKIAEGGDISTVAGLAGTSGINGTLTKVAATDARFNAPRGLACDNSGRIYVADTGNNQVRVIENGYVSHLAGNGAGTAGNVDGVGGDAQFNAPYGIAVNNTGVVYVTDSGNHSVRKITAGTVLTIAGDGTAGDGENIKASKLLQTFDTPKGLAVDSTGALYVCDSGNDKIKKIDPKGWVYLHSGNGTSGRTLGATGYVSSYNDLQLAAADRAGILYVVDVNTVNGSRLVKLDQDGKPAVVADFNGTSDNDLVLAVAVSPANKLFVTVSV